MIDNYNETEQFYNGKEDERPFPTILEAIFAQEDVSVHALYRLSDMTEAENKQFLATWQSADDERRRVIMRHLADISEDNFVVEFSPVFALGLQDSAYEVRLAGLDGLWDSTDVSLIDPITRLMQTDPSVEVRAKATASLAHYILMAQWEELPRRIIPPIVASLLAVYDDDQTALPIKRAALEAVSASAHERVPQMIREAYDSGDFPMQISAVFAMGNTADRDWMPIVLQELQNMDDNMRAQAVQAAGTIGSSDAVTTLIDIAFHDENDDVQAAAVVALGNIGSDQAKTALQKLSEDDTYEHLFELIDETMEEMEWMSAAFDLLDVDFEDED